MSDSEPGLPHKLGPGWLTQLHTLHLTRVSHPDLKFGGDQFTQRTMVTTHFITR